MIVVLGGSFYGFVLRNWSKYQLYDTHTLPNKLRTIENYREEKHSYAMGYEVRLKPKSHCPGSGHGIPR